MNADEGVTRGDLDTVDEIAELVRRFYREVAQDDLLGPIFNDVAQVDWAAHLPKLTAFWARALLSQPGYEGNPYRMHMIVHEKSPFTAAHFERWLRLFDEALAGWNGPHVDQARSFATRVAQVHSKALLGAPVIPVPESPPIPESPPVADPQATPTPVSLSSPRRPARAPTASDADGGRLVLGVRVDRATCIGSGQCVHWASNVFEQDAEAKAVVIAPSAGREDEILRAVVACPVEAISLEIGGAAIQARDLANWMNGVEIDDPLVDQLGRLSDEHHDLRTALTTFGASDDRAELLPVLSAQATDHLEAERAAYVSLRPLVGATLVDALLEGHAQIDRDLADLRSSIEAADHDRQSATSLAAAIENQIQLEESVLFPVALSALARHAAG